MDAPRTVKASNTDSGSTKIWIAALTTVGVILAAAIPAYFTRGKTEASHKYSGFVHSMPGDRPVYPASISISSGQDAPFTATTDSNGTFVLTVPKDVKSPILTVRAEGFVSEQRNVDLDRPNPEPIYLKPQIQSGDAPTDIKIGDVKNQGTLVIGNGNNVKSKAQ